MEKISILHIIDSLAVGGMERMLVDLVNVTDPSKYSILVCITRSNLSLAEEVNPGIPVFSLNRKKKFDFVGLKNFLSIIKRYKIDLIHCHGRSTYSFLLLSLLINNTKKPIIFHDHYGNIEIDEKTPLWFKYFGAKKLNKYVGVSIKLTKWAEKSGVHKNKITCINNSLNFNRFSKYKLINIREKYDIPLEGKIGIMIGNIRSAKGLDLLIDSCSLLNNKEIPFFIIIGRTIDNNYLDCCKEKIKFNNLDKKFIFLGEQKDPISWIKSSDFAVMPSRTESGPLVLIEYMANKLPFCAFNVGEISNLVCKLVPSQFAPSNDLQKFSENLERIILLSSNEMDDLGESNYKIAKMNFDIRNNISDWYNIYESTVKDYV